MERTPYADRVTRPEQIFIVDDHPVFREGLRTLVGQIPGVAICGEADNATRALDQIPRLQPDLVLLDITLPGKSGLELLQDLRSAAPDVPLLVVSMHDEVIFAERVIRLGGRGYIMKHEPPERLAEAIRTVLAGEVYLSRKASALILGGLSGHAPGGSKSPVSTLTDREFEILRLIGEGRDGHDIARELHLSLKTVDTHRGNLRKKLGLKNAAELVYHAVRWVAANP